jgi:hypothetical protein
MKRPPKNQIQSSEMVPRAPWPGAFGVYNYSKRVISYNLAAFLPVIVFAYLAELIATYSRPLVAILLYIVVFLLQLTGYVILLACLRHQKISIGDALDKATRLSLKTLCLYFIMGVMVALGLVLLIVPGIILIARLALAPYYLIDQNLSIKESLVTAWKNSEGHVTKTWGVIAVELLFAILALVLVGFYLTVVYSAAILILYKFENAQPKTYKK